jgi:hypothetical protein
MPARPGKGKGAGRAPPPTSGGRQAPRDFRDRGAKGSINLADSTLSVRRGGTSLPVEDGEDQAMQMGYVFDAGDHRPFFTLLDASMAAAETDIGTDSAGEATEIEDGSVADEASPLNTSAPGDAPGSPDGAHPEKPGKSVPDKSARQEVQFGRVDYDNGGCFWGELHDGKEYIGALHAPPLEQGGGGGEQMVKFRRGGALASIYI